MLEGAGEASVVDIVAKCCDATSPYVSADQWVVYRGAVLSLKGLGKVVGVEVGAGGRMRTVRRESVRKQQQVCGALEQDNAFEQTEVLLRV